MNILNAILTILFYLMMAGILAFSFISMRNTAKAAERQAEAMEKLASILEKQT